MEKEAAQPVASNALFGLFWFPIESAPRDRQILLFRPSAPPWARVAIGKFDDQRHNIRPRPFWALWLHIGSVIDARDWIPTHWMDLPSEPNASGEQPEEKTMIQDDASTGRLHRLVRRLGMSLEDHYLRKVSLHLWKPRSKRLRAWCGPFNLFIGMGDPETGSNVWAKLDRAQLVKSSHWRGDVANSIWNLRKRFRSLPPNSVLGSSREKMQQLPMT